jgi:hypothetical protein
MSIQQVSSVGGGYFSPPQQENKREKKEDKKKKEKNFDSMLDNEIKKISKINIVC